MSINALVLLPPVVVLGLGFFTRRVVFSLLCGIATAALLASSGNFIEGAQLAFHYFWQNIELQNYTSLATILESRNSFIALFLCMLGTIVTLIGHSGGSYAYILLVKKRLKNARSAQIATLLLSHALFVDDYFSCLTVGSVMQPITDSFRIPRVKLAFLIDALAAPLTILVPISSWVAAIIGWLSENGVSQNIQRTTLLAADPFSVYLSLIPFIFYPFLIIFACWFIVLKNVRFGSMKQFEDSAEQTGDVLGKAPHATKKMRSLDTRHAQTASIFDFIVPVITLLLAVLGTIQWTGGSCIFGGTRSIAMAFRHANPFLGLLVAGAITLALVIPFYLIRSKLHLHEIPGTIYEGIQLMGGAILVLILAWTLGDILRNDLKTGVYLAQLISHTIPVWLLPALFFITSLITSFALGSSWGASAIMFPIAIPMIVHIFGTGSPLTLTAVPIMLPVLGAILSGAIAGDHISPISDTTIMASTSSGCDHIEHVQTQFGYAWPVLVTTTLSFLIAGSTYSYGIPIMLAASISTGLALELALLLILKK